jgi:uncharacterized protein
MTTSSRPLRLLVLAVCALAAAALLWVVFGALRSGVALWQDVRAQPGWLQFLVAALATAAVLGLIWIILRFKRPRRRNVPIAAPTRVDVDQRIERLRQTQVDTATLQHELEELDRRARSEEVYVAVFGEISAGKSSLIRALVPEAKAEADVLGGTTRDIMHYRATTANGGTITFADVPGTHETGGAAREQIARDEALRAHVVLYVCSGDLTRDQDIEVRWLRGFGKPLVLVLNKADQFRAGELAQLQRVLAERYGPVTDAQAVVSAGGREAFERQLPDGRREQVQRERSAQIAPLQELLRRYSSGARALEPSREAAVLSAVAARADTLETDVRERQSAQIVAKYTKRAVVGAMAAVMPGSDLVIQGVLATALIRELGKLYDVPLRDLDIDTFLGQVKLTVRTSASLILAIAGNAMKAFPGLGTLGGGVLHAIAYGLIFDSMGRAVAQTLRDQRSLDSVAAGASLATLLADASAERLRQIARLTLKPDDKA